MVLRAVATLLTLLKNYSDLRAKMYLKVEKGFFLLCGVYMNNHFYDTLLQLFQLMVQCIAINKDFKLLIQYTIYLRPKNLLSVAASPKVFVGIIIICSARWA